MWCSRSKPDRHKIAVGDCQGVVARRGQTTSLRAFRRGFTLIELLFAASVTAIISIALGGIISVVSTTRTRSQGMQAAAEQSHAALQRIRFLVTKCGVYRTGGSPTTAGLAVVTHEWGLQNVPDTLVVWTGGRDGGIADGGQQTRLPKVNELIVFTPDPTAAGRLVEMAFPAVAGEIDFRDAAFASTIRSLILSPDAVQVLLCNRLRAGPENRAEAESAQPLTHVRFVIDGYPDEASLTGLTPGSPQWYAQKWAGGMAAGSSGFRQVQIRTELQLITKSVASSNSLSTASPAHTLPFFGSAVLRYRYEP